MNKFCSKCFKYKTLINFYKNKKDKLSSYCKSCISKKGKLYYLKNKDKKREYRIKNNNKIKARYQLQKKKWNEYNKKYHKKHSKAILKRKIEYTKNKYKNNLQFKLRMNLGNRLRKIIFTKNWRKNNSIIVYLGCSFEYLKQHLELQFKSGMNWENHGLFGWHIDHIIPLSSAKTKEELYKLCHYTNLQPLWAKDNLSKGNK